MVPRVLLLLVAALMLLGGVSSHRLLSKVDPRRSLGGKPPVVAHSRWEAGRSYTFEFTSKAAHIEKELPSAARVNPQTAIEDLGLWPFAVLGGKLTLSCSCRAAPGEADGAGLKADAGGKAANPAAGPVFCQAMIHGVRHECGRDVSRSGTTCAQLGDLAAELPVWPFGLVFGADGQLLEVRHHNLEGAQAAGIKQNLVVDLGVAPPTASEGYNARYTRSGTVGNVTVTTTYRVRPYTQMAHVASPPVDGLMVSKFRQSFVQPPEGANATSFLHRRRAWAYVVVGGDSEFEEAVAVPTRVASTEEAEVNPAAIPRAFNTTTLYVLSRLELNLRATGTVEPGTVPCPYHSVKEVADGKKAPAPAGGAAVFGAEADKKEAVDAAADQATRQGAKELVDALNKGGAAPAPGQEESSSASSSTDETPARVSPTSFLQTDELDAAAVDPLVAFRSVADGLEGVLAPVESGAARPMADRVMADTGDRAFAELLDAEATSFNAHNVAVGPDPEQ